MRTPFNMRTFLIVKKSLRNSWIFSKTFRNGKKTFAGKEFFVAKLIIQPLNDNLIHGLKEFGKWHAG